MNPTEFLCSRIGDWLPPLHHTPSMNPSIVRDVRLSWELEGLHLGKPWKRERGKTPKE